MRKIGYTCFLFLLLAVFTNCQAAKGSSGNGGGTTPPTPPQTATLTVTVSGPGSGTVTSEPKGINCPTGCQATFNQGTKITLTSTPGGGSGLDSWSGACSGSASTCTITLNSNQTVGASFRKGDVSLINHIVILLQENRSFDHYFGHLPDYWSANGYSSEPFDGEPADASNPGTTAGTSVSAYHLTTTCVENPSPSWNESHADWNHEDPTSSTPLLDGFVRTAASEKSPTTGLPYIDNKGIRVMGYYTDRELPYYYFMASNFGTSDRWFSPVMSRTQPNRMYLYAGTSHGHVYPLTPTTPQLSDQTIFQLLQNNGISWKIYVHPDSTGCTTPSCLFAQSYMNQFTFGSTIVHQYPQNLVPIAQYFSDLQNGTLPQVAFIEPASQELLDEHPADDDLPANAIPNVETGSQYAASLINALMGSSSWKDSVFFLSFDEGGGFYDHVPPQPAVSPDGIAPSDLVSAPTPDICAAGNGAGGYTCNFTLTGYRVPLIVISPFAKKHYVSHTVADYTALLKFIETRFNLPSLTARDAAQMDMSEFFDFVNEPWATPPTPPAQPTNGPCYLDHLP
ncbi:MAG TPA: alkaline phosphatase family protein [Terriglobales bacterium]|nr:alkaline phosphatase family protein [Terriglobales bacterium]